MHKHRWHQSYNTLFIGWSNVEGQYGGIRADGYCPKYEIDSNYWLSEEMRNNDHVMNRPHKLCFFHERAMTIQCRKCQSKYCVKLINQECLVCGTKIFFPNIDIIKWNDQTERFDFLLFC